jgi:hypothetical protein
MSKQASAVEWMVLENDSKWEQLCAPSMPEIAPGVATASPDRRYARRILAGGVLMLLLLASASAWGGRATQAGSRQHAREPRTTAPQELAAMRADEVLVATSQTGGQSATERWFQYTWAGHDVRALVQTAASAAHSEIEVQRVEVQGERAVVLVMLPASAARPAQRQTLFFQRTTSGWQPAEADAALWGPAHTLETPSFIFHFRRNDAAAVIAIAPQVEAIYQNMRQNFGLPLTPGAGKLVIEVSVTQPPGRALLWVGPSGRIIVPSPALYRAPVELTDTELLAQSVALSLLERVLTDAAGRHALGSSWWALLRGLRLWQVWDLNLPLAVWRKELMQWIYADMPANNQMDLRVLPENYLALCATHKLWMPSPTQLDIPLLCNDLDQTQWDYYSQGSLDPLIHLNQLDVPVAEDRDGYQHHIIQHSRPGKAIAAATLIEYAVATYGREHLPALVASLSQHNNWETLIPAVYGVSAADFEAGWQAYLSAHYGL